jgi:hypothetical protein
MAPARKITNTGTRKNIGKFASDKTSAVIPYESHLERDYIYFLEIDPDVINFLLLQCLGDPAYDKGTIGSKTIRLFNLLKDCQTELILLDELNHLFDRDSSQLIYIYSNLSSTWVYKYYYFRIR